MYVSVVLFVSFKPYVVLVISLQNFETPENLSAYEGLELRIKGDGRRYKLIVRTSKDWDAIGYTASFDTIKDQWQSVSCGSDGGQSLCLCEAGKLYAY